MLIIEKRATLTTPCCNAGESVDVDIIANGGDFDSPEINEECMWCGEKVELSYDIDTKHYKLERVTIN